MLLGILMAEAVQEESTVCSPPSSWMVARRSMRIFLCRGLYWRCMGGFDGGAREGRELKWKSMVDHVPFDLLSSRFGAHLISSWVVCYDSLS